MSFSLKYNNDLCPPCLFDSYHSPQASGKMAANKRTRNFIRFGKRSPLPSFLPPFIDDDTTTTDTDDAAPSIADYDPAALMADLVKRDSRMRRVSNFLRFGKRAAVPASAGSQLSPPICEEYLPPGFCTQLQLAKYGTQKKIKPFLRFGR
jgi:hypothetical protein